MLSQYYLRKYKQSLDSFNKYIYLVENFDISTQANEICCIEETICYKEYAQVKSIELYYKLEMYEDVINKSKKLNDIQLKKLYKIVFKSLYKLNQEKEILNIYISKSQTTGTKKEIIKSIEYLINDLKICDKEKIYLLFDNTNDNYGYLNKVRLGKNIVSTKYNEILINESDDFYGDLIYYSLKHKNSIEKILDKVSYYNIEKYILYVIRNRRESILILYNHLINQKNTLDIQRLSLYSIISKILLLEGNLKDEKIENLFFMYIMYRYEYLKQLYNINLNDEDILKLASDKDDIFVINIKELHNGKINSKLEYIKTLKNILIENPKYTEGIQILINRFEKEFEQNKELLQLKKQYKKIIENNINAQNLNIAMDMIGEYESMFDEDYEVLNLKAIIQIMMQSIEDADMTLKKAFMLNSSDYNTIFNIAYLKECNNETDDAIKFYTKIVNNCKEDEIILECKDKINFLNKMQR